MTKTFDKLAFIIPLNERGFKDQINSLDEYGSLSDFYEDNQCESEEEENDIETIVYMTSARILRYKQPGSNKPYDAYSQAFIFISILEKMINGDNDIKLFNRTFVDLNGKLTDEEWEKQLRDKPEIIQEALNLRNSGADIYEYASQLYPNSERKKPSLLKDDHMLVYMEAGNECFDDVLKTIASDILLFEQMGKEDDEDIYAAEEDEEVAIARSREINEILLGYKRPIDSQEENSSPKRVKIESTSA